MYQPGTRDPNKMEQQACHNVLLDRLTLKMSKWARFSVQVSIHLVNHVTASHLLLLNGSSSSVCSIYLGYLCRQSFLHMLYSKCWWHYWNTHFKMEAKAKKQQKVSGKNICASVYVLHLWKMTWIMSSVLTTLETNDINRVNRARSHTDSGARVFLVIKLCLVLRTFLRVVIWTPCCNL